MAHWLIKSEPDSWSWTQQVEAGKTGTSWNGVRKAERKLEGMMLVVNSRLSVQPVTDAEWALVCAMGGL